MRKTLSLLPLLLFVSLNALALSSSKVNNLLGIPLFGKDGWKEEPVAIGERLHIRLESTVVSGNPVYSGYTRTKSLGSTLQQIVIRCRLTNSGRTSIDSVQLVYMNKGDNQGASEKKFEKAFRENAKAIDSRLRNALGNPRHHRGASLWQLDDNTILTFENERNEYLMVTIARQGRDDQLSENQLRQQERRAIKRTDFTDNLATNNFGDCYIRSVPMVNQGDKGYCGPATLERCLLYYGITAYDMHSLAQLCDTTASGGTLIRQIHDESRKILRRYGLDLKSRELTMDAVAKVINKGHLIFWSHYYGNAINQRLSDNTAMRQHQTVNKWEKIIRKQHRLDKANGAHISLIIGYNRKTQEIAVSDSWGNNFNVRWLPIEDAVRITIGSIDVVTP